jgi:drug/metabolite transporter (DMT)-like permease
MLIIKVFDHLYILASIFFTVYSQLVMRWQVTLAGELPGDSLGKIWFLASLLVNPWVLSGVVATFLAGVSWMLAMARFEISYAYPFVGLSFILIMILSGLFFGESIGPFKILGTILVVLGVAVTTFDKAN